MLVLFILLENLLQVFNVGFSYSTNYSFKDGINHKTVSVSAGTHPWFILWALVALFLYGMYLKKEKDFGALQITSMWRRFWAFILDFFFSVTVLSSFLALGPLCLEAQRTGNFQWQFERDYSVPLDWLAWPLAFLMLVILFLYFCYPLTKGRPTVGGYLLRLVVAEKGKPVALPWPKAIKRVLWALLGFCVWPFTIIKGKDAEGKTWYDRKSGLQVMRYEKKHDEEKELHGAWYFTVGLLICGLAYAASHYLPSWDSGLHWRVYTYPDYHFSLESPMALPVDKPAYEKRELDADVTRELYIKEFTDDLNLAIDSTIYDKNIVPNVLDEYYQRIKQTYSSDPKTTNFKSDFKPVAWSGVKGAIVSGTYVYDGQPAQIEVLLAVKGNWICIATLRGLDTPEVQEEFKRVAQSFKILE
jgi:hypothetical protein